MFSYEGRLIYEWCCFYFSLEYIFYMRLYDDFTWFYIIFEVFRDSLNDVFFKKRQNYQRRSVIFGKGAGLK